MFLPALSIGCSSDSGRSVVVPCLPLRYSWSLRTMYHYRGHVRPVFFACLWLLNSAMVTLTKSCVTEIVFWLMVATLRLCSPRVGSSLRVQRVLSAFRWKCVFQRAPLIGAVLGIFVSQPFAFMAKRAMPQPIVFVTGNAKKLEEAWHRIGTVFCPNGA